MRERPIMFKGEMVRAILAGAKTQTRRPVKHRHDWAIEYRDGKLWPWHPPYVYGEDDAWMNCPYGVPGDRLWVRETWSVVDGEILYPANDGRMPWPSDHLDSLWDILDLHGESTRPSIHMPRWASRLTLEIVIVRVERVNSMTLADARAEGIPQMHAEAVAAGLCGETRVVIKDGPTCRDVWDNRTSVENFAALWDSLYAKTPKAWAANPWVWVVEFRRVDGGAE